MIMHHYYCSTLASSFSLSSTVLAVLEFVCRPSACFGLRVKKRFVSFGPEGRISVFFKRFFTFKNGF
jgi:hypothetical protein